MKTTKYHKINQATKQSNMKMQHSGWLQVKTLRIQAITVNHNKAIDINKQKLFLLPCHAAILKINFYPTNYSV